MNITLRLARLVRQGIVRIDPKISLLNAFLPQGIPNEEMFKVYTMLMGGKEGLSGNSSAEERPFFTKPCGLEICGSHVDIDQITLLNLGLSCLVAQWILAWKCRSFR
jgi:hypothetical protein